MDESVNFFNKGRAVTSLTAIKELWLVRNSKQHYNVTGVQRDCISI
jgi:hypothetical protein